MWSLDHAVFFNTECLFFHLVGSEPFLSQNICSSPIKLVFCRKGRIKAPLTQHPSPATLCPRQAHVDYCLNLGSGHSCRWETEALGDGVLCAGSQSTLGWNKKPDPGLWAWKVSSLCFTDSSRQVLWTLGELEGWDCLRKPALDWMGCREWMAGAKYKAGWGPNALLSVWSAHQPVSLSWPPGRGLWSFLDSGGQTIRHALPIRPYTCTLVETPKAVQSFGGHILAWPLTSCVTLGQVAQLSSPTNLNPDLSLLSA